MKIVEFYKGLRGNTNGDKLADILTWTDGQLEVDHDWVQWTFPSNEPSMLNGDAPTMTKAESQAFLDDPELSAKVLVSAERFFDFLGFRTAGEIIMVEAKEPENVPWWLRGAFNHNCLRVTRLLKSLRLTGNGRHAVAFYEALVPYKHTVSQNTWSHWYGATFEPLWVS